MTTGAIRSTLSEIREKVKTGQNIPDTKKIIEDVEIRLRRITSPSLRPVINATGVVLHTNLGRAPLSDETILAMRTVTESYNNLELDLKNGKRGKRSSHIEETLRELTGAESALVVNNNAGAVLLILSALAKRRKVIIPNSQLVEIGGGFRIPDVMRQSGAKLVAIGTTNRIHKLDYVQALEEGAALVLNAHHSNFKIIGFTTEPGLSEVASISRNFDVPFVYDQGSGALLDTDKFGLPHEPTVFDGITAGADLVCFSGDKLLGGPQAGIIVGNSDLLKKIKRHPLARAIRADKSSIAGLNATLLHYLKDEALQKIPIWQMIAKKADEIEHKARKWQKELNIGEVEENASMIGGGSLPTESLPTYVLAHKVKRPDAFLKELRNLPVPIIARIEKDKVLFDPRTVQPDQEKIFLDQLSVLVHGLD